MRSPSLRRLAAASLLLYACGPQPATPGATEVRAQAADSVLRDFLPSGEYVLVLDGKTLPNAEIYRSVPAAAFLLIASELESPVLLSPALQSVETVQIMKVLKQPDGSIDLLADAILARQGRLRVENGDVLFTVQGKQGKLTVRPPLLKWQTSTQLLAHDPGYARRAKAYSPESPAVAVLKSAPPARVLVFFGSWCPHCAESVPRLLRVQQEIAGSGLQFEYYGLPQPPGMTADPEAKRWKISFVPQAVVLRGDREVGRLDGGDWLRPERSLQALLATP